MSIRTALAVASIDAGKIIVMTRCDMAIGAIVITAQIFKLEAGFIMIKAHQAPFRAVMTNLALQRNPFMRIILGMAQYG
jgi:hypothetical protein